jgi:hypothetical protein
MAHRTPHWTPDQIEFRELMTIATSLGRVLSGARAVGPDSFARAGESGHRRVRDAALIDLRNRVQVALDQLNHLATRLSVALASPSPTSAALSSRVNKMAGYGIPVPKGAAGTVVSATAVLAEAARRVDEARALLNATTPFDAATGVAAGKILFGDAFSMLPVVSSPVPDLFSRQLGRIQLTQAELRRFLRDVGSVRPSLSTYADTLLHSDALGVERRLVVAQLAAPGTSGASVWLGGLFDPDQPSPSAPVTSVLIEGPANLTGRQTLAGLVIDEWVEVVPTRSPAPGRAHPSTRVTAGLAANVDVPDARAPQAILLAVSPDGQRWTTQSLAGVLVETLSLAKVRAVTLERTALVARILPALQVRSWSLQGEETLDLSMLVTQMFRAEALLPFVKD